MLYYLQATHLKSIKLKEKNFLNKLIFEYDEILHERNKHLDIEKGNNYEDLQKHNQNTQFSLKNMTSF